MVGLKFWFIYHKTVITILLSIKSSYWFSGGNWHDADTAHPVGINIKVGNQRQKFPVSMLQVALWQMHTPHAHLLTLGAVVVPFCIGCLRITGVILLPMAWKLYCLKLFFLIYNNDVTKYSCQSIFTDSFDYCHSLSYKLLFYEWLFYLCKHTIILGST